MALFERVRARHAEAGRVDGILSLLAGSVMVDGVTLAPILDFLGAPISEARTHHHRRTDPFDARGFVALHGESTYAQFLAHYQEYTDVAGDHFRTKDRATQTGEMKPDLVSDQAAAFFIRSTSSDADQGLRRTSAE